MEDTKFEPRYNEVFFDMKNKDGTTEEHCIESTALAKLLVDDVLFCNTRHYATIKYNHNTKKWDDDFGNSEETIVLFVICNDIWSWGCADAETITVKEIPELYKMHIADSKWGSLKWACKKRNLQPQKPIIKDMKKEGAWCELMESLEKNNE